MEHNESVVGKEISSKGLLPATPELRYNEIVDQHLLLEKPQLTELNVRLKKIKDDLVYHDKAVQTDVTVDQITRMEQTPLKQLDKLKRDLFMEDVQQDDSGLPSLSCLLVLFYFLKPVKSYMKHWDEKSKNWP